MNEEKFYTPFSEKWLKELCAHPLEATCGQVEFPKTEEPDWDVILMMPKYEV